MANLASPLTNKSILYTWKELIKRASIPADKLEDGALRVLDIPVFYGLPGATPALPYLTICRSTESSWGELLERPNGTLVWKRLEEAIPRSRKINLESPLPVLFWGDGYEHGNKPVAERRSDGSVIFYADIIAASFFMLSQWEETVVFIRDKHDRFPASASVACKQGFLERPIVDEYALILREWLNILLPDWKPVENEFHVKINHDIDSIRRFPNVRARLMATGFDIVRGRDFGSLGRNILGGSTNETDPHFRAIYNLAQMSLDAGLKKDAFYFMAADSSSKDNGYDVTSAEIRTCIKYLERTGCEIGFHPGYYTFDDAAKFAIEKTKIKKVLGNTKFGSRQHYLRFKVPETWRILAKEGISYDATLGFFDHVGFRCGTCHRFKPFDTYLDDEMDLEEEPLIVMDMTLVNYMTIKPHEGYEVVRVLAERCRRVKGTFTFLWHNTSFQGEYIPWMATYLEILKLLGSMKA
jgi:hypothetical protein